MSPLAALPTPLPAPVNVPADHVTRVVFYAAVGALFVGIALLLVMALVAVHRNRTSVGRRLRAYTLGAQPLPAEQSEPGALGDSAVARTAMELAGRVVTKSDLRERLTRKLDAAGIPLKPEEWLLLHAGGALGLGVILLLVSFSKPWLALIGLAAGAVAPPLFLSSKQRRRQAAFLAQLPDTLQLMAGSLAAGYSLAQSVDAIVREASEPIAGEFNKALIETRLGVPVEDALETVGARMGSQDFGWVVMAIRIQREVGGNLAELLTIVAGTLRERERLRRLVRTLSAEGRLSAVILSALPPLLLLYLLVIRPTYIKPMFHAFAGLVMLGVGVVLMVIGGLWLRKVVNVEV